MIEKAGSVLINVKDKKIALIYKNGFYGFPKGHIEDNESIQECAVRETIEETCHDCHLIDDSYRAVLHYKNNQNNEITLYIFLSIDDGKTDRKIKEKDKEITIWEDFDTVYKKLEFQILKDVWNILYKEIKEILNEKEFEISR